MTRVVSFNINGVRARPHQLEALRERYDPDIIGLRGAVCEDSDRTRGISADRIRQLNERVREQAAAAAG